MKNTLLSFILLLALASCKKFNGALPDQDKLYYGGDGQTEVTKPATPEETLILNKLPVTPAIYNPVEQKIVASVADNKLNLSFNEQVQLLIDAARYKTAWYVVFKEDYTGTRFSGFDFTTITAWGAEVENWTPNNLSQIDRTEKDTVVGGIKVVSVKFKRTLKFFKKFATNAEAVDKMNSLIGQKDVIKFKTRYEPDSDSTRYDVVNLNVVYTK